MPLANHSKTEIDEAQLVNPRSDGGKVKVTNRPVAITRQSNEYFTELTRHSTVYLSNRSGDDSTSSSLAGVPQQISEKKVMTSTFPPKNKARIIAACLWSVSSGFSDAAPGALLPTIEAHYHISYSVVSLIWMSNAVGFITVALLSHKIQPLLGREKAVPFGCICSLIMYAVVGSGGPFPLVVVGFFFGGMGVAISLAQINVFLSKLDKNSKYLSFAHGSYGIGATVSPLLATMMVERNIRWNYVYLIMLGLMSISLVSIGFAFKGADEDLKYWDNDEETEKILGTEANESTPVPTSGNEEIIGLQNLERDRARGSENTPKDNPPTEISLALRNKVTWLISLFVLFYQGCEVAIGGWIVTYLIDYRHTTTSFGYASSGFWGGFTVGRLFLTRPLHTYLGVRKSVSFLIVTTILMLVLTWVVSSSILSSVFVSIAGTLIGPIYPLMITGVSQMLPRKIQVISLTIMTAFGSSGGALIPLFVGLISQSVGTYVVLPISIAGYVLVLVFWLMLPNTDRKGDLPKSKAERLLYIFW